MTPKPSRAPRTKKPRLRLLRVDVQAHFVMDDGDTLQELPGKPMSIPAADWPAYSGDTFPEAVKELEARLT